MWLATGVWFVLVIGWRDKVCQYPPPTLCTGNGVSPAEIKEWHIVYCVFLLPKGTNSIGIVLLLVLLLLQRAIIIALFAGIVLMPFLWPIGSGRIDVVLITTMMITQWLGDTPPKIDAALVIIKHHYTPWPTWPFKSICNYANVIFKPLLLQAVGFDKYHYGVKLNSLSYR